MMKAAWKRYRHNGSIWDALGALMYGANSFLLLLLVSRQSGLDAAGVFGIAFTTAQILWIVGVFGASHLQMTDYAHSYSFHAYRKLKIGTNLLMLAVAMPVCLLLGFDGEKTTLTLLLTVYMLAHSISELYQNRMFQENRLDLAGRSQFFRTLLSLVCFVICLLLTKDLIAATVALTSGNLLAIWLFSYIPCRPYLSNEKPTTAEDLRGLTLSCLPLFFGLFLMNLVIQLPKYTIEAMGTDAMQGVFNLIFMPAQVINLVSGFIFRPLMYRISVLAAEKQIKGVYTIIQRQGLLVLGFTVVCVVLTWFFGVLVLGIVYRTDLRAYRLPLTLIIVGGGLFAFDQFLYYIAVILRKQRGIMMNYIVVLILGTGLCIWLVGQLNVLGAACTFIAMHAILLIGYSILITVSFRRMQHA